MPAFRKLHHRRRSIGILVFGLLREFEQFLVFFACQHVSLSFLNKSGKAIAQIHRQAAVDPLNEGGRFSGCHVDSSTDRLC